MDERAPSPAGGLPASEADIQQLLVDIYAATGDKITRDDPVVTAALVQAALIKQAGIQAAAAIGAAAKAVEQNELDALHARFTEAATVTLEKVRQDGALAAPGALRARTWTAAAVVALCCAMLGLAAGYGVGAQQRLSDQEIRQLAAGKDFLTLLEKTDDATRARLADLVQKANRQ